MKKSLLLAITAILAVGCASLPKRPNAEYTSLNTNEKIELLKETAGLALEYGTLEAYTVTYASSEFKQYYQPQSVSPGENINSLFRKEDLLAGDILLSINDMSAINNADAIRQLNSLNDRAALTFFDSKKKELKVYKVLSKDALSQLFLSSATTTLDAIRIKTVVPGSWADQKGLKEGDYLVRGTLFDGEYRKYFLFSKIPAHKARAQKETMVFSDIGSAATTLLKVFEDKRALSGTEKLALMKESFLKLSVVSGDKFTTYEVHRTRFLGLGVKFDCPVAISCGKVLPHIMVVYPNSDGGRAGFQEEDLVTEIDGVPVNTSVEAVEKIHSAPLGKEMTFKVSRGLKVLTIKAAKGLVVIE